MDLTQAESRIATLESNFFSVTDQIGKLMDRVLQKGFIPAFRCAHSGLLLPASYVKDWGRSSGIGLGPSPVSEVLDTDYDTAPDVPKGAGLKTFEQIMHPVGPCMSQVDFDLFEPSVWEASQAILDIEDPGMHARAKIVRVRQLANPKNRIGLFAAKLEVR